MSDYEAFIAGKSVSVAASGFDPGANFADGYVSSEGHRVFPHQRDVTRWALRRGRAALFLSTGLGKTLCLLIWADYVERHTGQPVLVVAPLAVSEQTKREAERWGIDGVTLSRGGAPASRIVITNYEMVMPRVDKKTKTETWPFDRNDFGGIVLDESSRLKDENGAQRNALIAFASAIPFRLCCSATPAPNDHTELGSHSEFLGLKSRVEMLAEYFVHDGGSTQDWRLKGHAVQAFYDWVATWGAMIHLPSDLGHDDGGYALPPLEMIEHVIPADTDEARARGLLFVEDAKTIGEQRAVRRATIDKRIALAADIASGPEQCLVWVELNDEGDAAASVIDGAVQVAGSDDVDTKRERLVHFAEGRARVLVTKGKIAGAGLNLQSCWRMVFVGASHSYEQMFQSIRRCWRFGQTHKVEVHVIRAESEGAVIANYRRKEAEAERLASEMGTRMRDVVRAEVLGLKREWNEYAAHVEMLVPTWLQSEAA